MSFAATSNRRRPIAKTPAARFSRLTMPGRLVAVEEAHEKSLSRPEQFADSSPRNRPPSPSHRRSSAAELLAAALNDMMRGPRNQAAITRRRRLRAALKTRQARTRPRPAPRPFARDRCRRPARSQPRDADTIAPHQTGSKRLRPARDSSASRAMAVNQAARKASSDADTIAQTGSRAWAADAVTDRCAGRRARVHRGHATPNHRAHQRLRRAWPAARRSRSGWAGAKPRPLARPAARMRGARQRKAAEEAGRVEAAVRE